MYYVALRGGTLVKHEIFGLGYTSLLKYQGNSLSEAQSIRDALGRSMYAIYTLDRDTMSFVEVKEG